MSETDFDGPWWPWDDEAERARVIVFAVARWIWNVAKFSWKENANPEVGNE